MLAYAPMLSYYYYAQNYHNSPRPNSHHSGGTFLAGKPSLALSGCLPIKSADYGMLINEWAWLTSRVCLLRLEVQLASVLESALDRNGDTVR